jgi:hypothetical protein
MAKRELDPSNWDKAGTRLWLSYHFWRPVDFAINHGIAERTVRHYLTLGIPSHGVAHKGSGGIRLAKSAATWLMTYRALTVNGAFRFSGMPAEFLDDLSLAVADEALAFWKLYGGPRPTDADADLMKYLSPSDAAREKRSWQTGFKEITRRSA